MPRWYGFEVQPHATAAREYIGKVFTTEVEVRAAFPHATIVGNLVTITSRPPVHPSETVRGRHV